MTKKRQKMKFILLLKCVYKTSLIKNEQTNKKPNKAFGKNCFFKSITAHTSVNSLSKYTFAGQYVLTSIFEIWKKNVRQIYF